MRLFDGVLFDTVVRDVGQNPNDRITIKKTEQEQRLHKNKYPNNIQGYSVIGKCPFNINILPQTCLTNSHSITDYILENGKI